MKPKKKTNNVNKYNGISKKYGNGKRLNFIKYLFAIEKRRKKIKKKKKNKAQKFFNIILH